MAIELILRYVKILAVFAVVWLGVWLFNNFGCSRVDGPEMQPALPMDKNALLDPKIRRPEQLSHDDVVAFEYDFDGRGVPRKVTTRVVGLPGDRVKIVRGDVYVNGEKVSSNMDKKAAPDDYAEIFVPRDTVFALCDNRGPSKGIDSRKIGPIGSWAILGKLR